MEKQRHALMQRGALPSWRKATIQLIVTIQRMTEIDGADMKYRSLSYKGDGARFDLDTTIKFNINGTYELSIIFRPVVRIERMEIMGDVKTPSEKSRDLESVTYVAYFDTKAKQNSKNGKRDKIHIFLDAKYYREKDNHAVWGNQLHHIDLEAFCSGGEVKISKMLFW
ncbi:uncharacterized protein LOC111268331 isoform X3 [Varroa jacobsoni]|uniref:uncharacterized protein LOC111268331 isoform X3 n=1 Tax=Varroa jacobsoni TaxID=62625 RepID=UPI000BF8BDB0|nr:uncharacterized protein LOC111268331 isoform X3 [Varroa jacobsoni]